VHDRPGEGKITDERISSRIQTSRSVMKNCKERKSRWFEWGYHIVQTLALDTSMKYGVDGPIY